MAHFLAKKWSQNESPPTRFWDLFWRKMGAIFVQNVISSSSKMPFLDLKKRWPKLCRCRKCQYSLGKSHHFPASACKTRIYKITKSPFATFQKVNFCSGNVRIFSFGGRDNFTRADAVIPDWGPWVGGSTSLPPVPADNVHGPWGSVAARRIC